LYFNKREYIEQDTQIELVTLRLPEGLLNYFEVTKVNTVNHEIWIYIKELNDPPIEFSNDKLLSKGFLPETCIQDFPLRGKTGQVENLGSKR